MEDNKNRVKLMLAIENDEIDEALKILDEDDSNELLQPLGLLGITVVHLAAWKGHLDLLKRFLERGANIKSLDKIGRSALFYAAHAGHLEVTQWLLKNKSSTETRIGIDSCRRHGLKIQETSKVDCRVGQDLPVPECCGRTPLHQAAKNNHSDVVKTLVEAGANVNAQDERGITALLLAGCNVNSNDVIEMSKFVEIIDVLVSAKASTNVIHSGTGLTALHLATALGSPRAVRRLLEGDAWPLFQCADTKSTPLHIAADAGNLETLLVLLKKIRRDHVDIRDKIGQTALHLACYQGHRECARVLIDHGGYLSAETKSGVTVIDVVFAHIPGPISFLTDIMDTRVRFINHQNIGEDAHISIDFSILAPHSELQTNVIIALIAAASNVEQLGILQHPLIESFLHLKWAKLRVFFFLLVFLYVSFVLSLSTFAITLLRQGNCHVPQIVLSICSTMLLLYNTAQVMMLPRHYIRQFETWLSFISAALSFMVCMIVDNIRFVVITSNGIRTPELVLHSISIAILLGWIQMMLLIGRFPTWGYYALMFSTVLSNILKVLLAFVCMIFGFALSFTVLFHNNEQFHDCWKAIVKTVVMMMGEYDYENLFPSDTKGDKSFLTVTSRVIFLGFIILASMVLMNLMIGLAVNDIQGLQKEGHIRRLLKQAEFVAHLEKLTSHQIFKSNWLHPWFRTIVNSRRVVTTKMLLHCRDNNLYESFRGISIELMESLFLLASRNNQQNERNRVGFKSSRIDTNAMSLLINLQEQIQQLQKLYCPSIPDRRSKLFALSSLSSRYLGRPLSPRRRSRGFASVLRRPCFYLSQQTELQQNEDKTHYRQLSRREPISSLLLIAIITAAGAKAQIAKEEEVAARAVAIASAAATILLSSVAVNELPATVALAEVSSTVSQEEEEEEESVALATVAVTATATVAAALATVAAAAVSVSVSTVPAVPVPVAATAAAAAASSSSSSSSLSSLSSSLSSRGFAVREDREVRLGCAVH
ncbi:transient receptor potential channel pyrexia-like [Vespula maculifrons]|uniref:Transient receptor potential channel pyrexia-like n=1 Tax=Vespula maculifrons TaxID=7453 RepID=A0ABD2CXX7_VESMC